ncbi:MAG: menaquinol oxidoreductase, partial [bacterium]
MRVFVSLLIVAVLVLIAWMGVSAGAQSLFGIVFPYAAIVIFLLGVIWRIFDWARSAVPFRIPTTCGQQKSHDWIKSSTLEAPHNGWGVLRRMFLEVVLFRSLFRNTTAEINDGPHLSYGSSKWLWGFSLAFHWTFLVIFVRHFKFFAEPVPQFV